MLPDLHRREHKVGNISDPDATSSADLTAAGSASLLLGAGAMLSAHLGAVHWLAKDLVWVLPDEGCPGGAQAGLRHWVRRYQLPHKVGLRC